MSNAWPKTEVDSSTARRSARDQWAHSALASFQSACRHWRDDPGRSLELVRKVIEGCAHAICVALHEDFPPHRGTQLNRKQLGEVLPIARRHLPADLQVFVDTAKKLGDFHHHNQGEVPASSPLTAQAMLLQCVALLQWLHQDVLGTAPPPELRTAIEDLSHVGTAPVAPRPRRKLLGVARGLGLVVLGAATGALWLFAGGIDTAAPARGRATPFENLNQPERGWIEAYQSAIDDRDVDRILALHVLPARRFFLAQNFDGRRLRKLLQGWFEHAGPTRRTGFDRCARVDVASDGARSIQCDTYIDPPFPDGGPSRVATCLVFTREGKVLSRTEIARIPGCPPP